MRRSMVPMCIALAVWSTPLRGQQALLFGYAGTLGGGNWQIESAEFGLVSSVAAGPVRGAAVSLRAGWFGDQAVLLRGTRGFVGALALALRSGALTIAEVGGDANPTVIGFACSFEGAGYVAANSPPTWDKRWMSVALLPELRIGAARGARFTVVAGPAWFLGNNRQTHAFVAARGEFPLARGKEEP